MPKNKQLTVQAVEKELNPMLAKAKTITITGEKDMHTASEFLSQLNLATDRVTAQMETITKPAKETIKAAEAIWKPFIIAAKDAIKLIREKTSDYQTEQVRLKEEEENRIAARVGEGKGKLKPETASKQIAEIDAPAEKIITASGSLKFRADPQFEVIDKTLLPIEYILADEVKIRAAMKAGTQLPGVRYFTKQVPINNR